MLAPILLFVYKPPRPHPPPCWTALLANAEGRPKPPSTSIATRPRDDSQRQAVGEVRSLVRQVVSSGPLRHGQPRGTHRETTAWHATSSTASATSSGSTGASSCWRTTLVLSPYFLRFMKRCPRWPTPTSRAWGHIQAVATSPADPTLPPTFLIRWTGSWGWATWERAWRLFPPRRHRPAARADAAAADTSVRLRRCLRPYTRMFAAARPRARTTRGPYAGNASLFLAGVPVAQRGAARWCRNRGFDGSGTNCGGGSPLRHPAVDAAPARREDKPPWRRTSTHAAPLARYLPPHQRLSGQRP